MSLRRFIALALCALALVSCSAGKYAARGAYPYPSNPYKPEGTLESVMFPSSEAKLPYRQALVYLPPSYAKDTAARYPVLYLFHGARGNETVWIDKGNLLHDIDSLMAGGAMLPTIVVLPNMNQYNDEDDYGNARLKSALESFYEVDGTVESLFLESVVAPTDSLFRTIPDKAHRAIAGMSIGAMQALHISANFPDKFDYVGMFSPMVRSFLKPGPDNKFYRGLALKQAEQFTLPPKEYMLMIGKTDFFYPRIRSYSAILKGRGIPCEFISAEGGHEWYNWEEFCCQFLQRLWRY